MPRQNVTPRHTPWGAPCKLVAERSALLPVVLALLLSATASAANFVVTANPNLTFSPNSLTINAGDTVTFRNGGGIHNVVSDPGSVTSFSLCQRL